jgi:hypothetical protein
VARILLTLETIKTITFVKAMAVHVTALDAVGSQPQIEQAVPATPAPDANSGTRVFKKRIACSQMKTIRDFEQFV